MAPDAGATKPPSDGKSDHTVSDGSGHNNDDVPPVNTTGDLGQRGEKGGNLASGTPAGPAGETGTKVLPEPQGNQR